MGARTPKATLTLPSLTGKAHYDVEESLRRVAIAVGHLQSAPPAADHRQTIQQLRAQVAALQSLVQTLNTKFKKVETIVIPPTTPVRGGGI